MHYLFIMEQTNERIQGHRTLKCGDLSIASCTYGEVSSAGANGRLWEIVYALYMHEAIWVSGCYFGGLFCITSFCFVAAWMQSLRERWLTVLASLLCRVFSIYFRPLNCTLQLNKETNYFFGL